MVEPGGSAIAAPDSGSRQAATAIPAMATPKMAAHQPLRLLSEVLKVSPSLALQDHPERG